MAKTASQRRQSKLALELRRLHDEQPGEFARIWAVHMRGWLAEVRHRARAHQNLIRTERVPSIVGVFNRASQLARTAGVEQRANVAETLVTLEHECCKAVAHVTDPRLYSFEECTTQRARFTVTRIAGTRR